MAKNKKKSGGRGSNGANLGFEDRLWADADKKRGSMDAAEYKHVALKIEPRFDPQDSGKYLPDNAFLMSRGGGV